jgi:hypothetical protein
MNQADARERQLAVRSDRISISGKVFFSVTSATAGVTTFPMNPTFFGDRVTRHATLYSRWRILKVIIQNGPAVGGLIALGVVDDYTSEGGAAPSPSTISEVVQLRCSRANISTVNPSEFDWKPLDRDKLYYTQNGAATAPSDLRLTTPGTFAVGATAAITSLSIVVYYTIEFEGAYDNSA